ncbi:MAG TPA: oligosaccharide flippase family protein [Candidatus Paceibacterota bacterium]|nr:oligosaccharide flippase family protein [Candidatus Paceibacterota bacterium]
MFRKLKDRLYHILRWSEKYTKTDMVYFAASNFWLNTSRFVSIGTGMFLTVAFANLLPPEVFGTYKYVLASAGFIGIFALNGLGTAMVRAAAQGKFHVLPAVVRTANLWSIPGSLAALAVSIYYFVQGNSDLGFAFFFISISNTFASGFVASKNIWNTSGNFKMATISGIPRTIVPFFIILLTILYTHDIVLILLAYFGSNLLASWLGYLFTLWWFRIKESKKDVEETMRYGKQMTALSFFQIASGYIDQLLLWHFTTPATLAIYALGLAPVNEAQNLINNFLAILFPKLANKTEAEVHQTLPLRIKQVFLVSCAVAFVYIIAVPFLFMFLFPQYLASVLVSQILAIVILLHPTKSVVDVFFTAHALVGARAKVIIGSQIVRFGLFVTLIPFFGLWGAVAATILSELGAALVFLWMYMRLRAEFRKSAV